MCTTMIIRYSITNVPLYNTIPIVFSWMIKRETDSTSRLQISFEIDTTKGFLIKTVVVKRGI